MVLSCCDDNNPKIFKVEFNAGKSVKVNDVILLCSKCYNKPPFDRFVLKVERLKTNV